MTTGFIGLGRMGSCIARNLLAAGFDLAVHDALPAAMESLASAGARTCASPAEVAASCDAIILMVHNDTQCEAVLFGDGGICESARPGSLIVAMSTLPPGYVTALVTRLAPLGVEILDAPVSGGVEGARRGSLTIMAAGSDTAFERADALFRAMGQHIVKLGSEPGLGQTTKVLNQLMYFTGIAVASEAVVAASRAGIDVDRFVEAVSHGSGDNWALRNRVPLAWQNDYRSGGALDIAPKDIGAALALCRELGVHTPIGAAASQSYLAATRLCRDDADDAEYVRLVEILSRHRIAS